MTEITGGELFARALQAEGIEFLFGLPCPEIDPLLAQLDAHGIRMVPVRHEAAGVHMAEGLYKTTGKVAVVLGNPGPGSANLLPGVVTALHEGVPVLAITSQHRLGIVYPSPPSTFQGQDQLDLFRPAVKWGGPVFEWARIPEVLRLAFREMHNGRPGPVHVELPAPILYETGDPSTAPVWPPAAYRVGPPQPSLIDVFRCGICGSDLHARHHCDELADVMAESGYYAFMRSNQHVVFGHEFCGEVLDYGPSTRKAPRPGTPVVAMPLLRRGKEVHGIGLSTMAPGAYAEQLLVEQSLTFPVPNGLAPEIAALTEPMAVGWHAVRRGEVGKGDVAIVIGCGPIGLAVICMLKAHGVRTVIASDFSSGRRALATACGADTVVDPAQDSPYTTAASRGHLQSILDAFDLAVGTIEKLQKLRLPWWHLWRAAEAAGAATPKHPVIFECVGVPGMIDDIITSAPLFSRVVVVGVCMGADHIRPAMAINKKIDLRFVLGYTPLEFRDTLHMLADGKVNVAPLITGTVGLPGVEAAFDALGDPEAHAKILIDPKNNAASPQPVG